jgi:AAA domain/DnaB-like helicase N terminal domain
LKSNSQQNQQHAAEGNNGSLPFSEEGELGVLSSWIHLPAEVSALCAQYLKRDHLYRPAHQIVFDVLLGWQSSGEVEFPWLRSRLKESDQIEEAGGDQFLNELYRYLDTGTNAKRYIDLVLEAWQRRSVILECQRREKAAFDKDEPVEAFDPEGLFAAKQQQAEVFSVRQLLDFDRGKDGDSVIGNRWLCKGDSLLISGPTGIGKSSFATQGGIHWALGRKFFGIACCGPQKILVIQSENNLGDLAIAFQDICDRIGITHAEEARLSERMVFVRESEKTGDDFIRFARTLIERHQPTIVLVDPLLSFVGGDVNRQEVMSAFLRNGIQPMLNETGIIWIFVHHTGKPPKEQAGKPAGGNAYSALGSSEILNWPREVLTFVVRDWNRRVFAVEFRKRARQAGITTPDGSPTYELVIRHSEQGVVWEACSEDEIENSEPETNGRKGKCSPAQLAALLGEERLSYTDFWQKAGTMLTISEATFKRHLKAARSMQLIHFCKVDDTYEVQSDGSHSDS